ncbi:MAG: hypothetical protein ACFWUE_05765 [Xylanivirga thermophila]|jgi:hypothetical protein|nr:hypothetical protein [Xylanivirga thermophila]
MKVNIAVKSEDNEMECLFIIMLNLWVENVHSIGGDVWVNMDNLSQCEL